MTILPIVNSLTELPEIEKVQFLVEGEKEKLWLAILPLMNLLSAVKSILKSPALKLF